MTGITFQGTRPVLMIVSHSHWDREWHMPFQQFRIKLGKMIDSLLNILKDHPDFCYFMLDGQTILLEDYAELRPERIEELRSHIRNGRILVGPWYVLPDEFLVSGEALIRNLLRGREIAKAHGGCMNVGYLPDQFGHIAQMPQILRTFGIDSAVLWRGVDDDLIESTEFAWRAPDGSGVLAINIPDGYFNAGGLSTEPAELTKRIRSIVDRLSPKANTRFLLLMNGGDHEWPQPALPAIISTMKSRLGDVEVVHTSLPAYIGAVERVLAEKGVQTEVVTGELRRCKMAHLLPGVLSTRMWIKQRNTRCENLLEKWAEPFTALAWIEATTGPKPGSNGSASASQGDTSLVHGRNWQMPLNLVWKYLLQNQPHDSICGCSIDQVHEEMRVRYDWVEQIGETLVEESLEELSQRVDTTLLTAQSPAHANEPTGEQEGPRDLVVFNPLPCLRTDLATFQAPAPESGFRVVDDSGTSSPCQVLEEMEDGKQTFGFVAADVPGIGYKAYRIEPVAGAHTTQLQASSASGGSGGSALTPALSQSERGPAVTSSTASDIPAQRSRIQIENEFFVVKPNETDGTVDVLDRTANQIYIGLNRFSDIGDAGDEYNLDRPSEDIEVLGMASSPEVRLIESGPARSSLRIGSVLRIPKELNPDRKSRSSEMVDCPVTTTVSLYPGVRRIDFATTVENRAKDHCLRARFPTGVKADGFHTEMQFDVLRRDVSLACAKPGWVEDPVATQPQKSFVDVNDGDRGLLLANRGLPECEVWPEVDGLTIALTLLRCVGWLSRGDLRSRRGNAGPEWATPGAQLLGTHDFDYAVVPHAGGWRDVSSQAHQLNNPLRVAATGEHPGQLPSRLSFISITPEWVPVSAIKPSLDGNGVIVRLFNPTWEPVDVELRSYKQFDRAERVDSKEDGLETLSGPADRLHVGSQPKSISTMKLYYW